MGEMIKGAVLFPGTDRILPSSHFGLSRYFQPFSLQPLPTRLVLTYICTVPKSWLKSHCKILASQNVNKPLVPLSKSMLA